MSSSDSGQTLRFSPEDVLRRKAYLSLTEEDEARLREIHPHLLRHADRMIERFYEHLLAHPETRAILEAPGLVERLKGVQRTYFEGLTQGKYDVAYFEDRLRVGYAHERIGLTPEWYLGAYRAYLEIIADVLGDELGRDSVRHREVIESLLKVICLDMGLAMDAYTLAGKDRLRRQNEKLESLDVQKRLLADTIVHDLRNPLAGIQGFLWSLKGSSEALTGSQLQALQDAERACMILHGMIDNVLGISRIERGEMPVAIESVDLRDMLGEVRQVMDPFAKSKERDLRVQAGEKTIRVKTDGNILRRMLLNLVMNGIRHAAGGTFVEISLESNGGRARIHVSDDGKGIERRHQGALFDRYATFEMRREGLKMDTGLGLAFCEMAAKVIGAELELESEPGRGTRFTIVL